MSVISNKIINNELQLQDIQSIVEDGARVKISEESRRAPADLIIVELLDENNNPVKDGEVGEVTITTIGVEAMPLVRCKTGDMCIRFAEPCKCGRNSARLSSVLGRKYCKPAMSTDES